jgi:hypothetical protein
MADCGPEIVDDPRFSACDIPFDWSFTLLPTGPSQTRDTDAVNAESPSIKQLIGNMAFLLQVPIGSDTKVVYVDGGEDISALAALFPMVNFFFYHPSPRRIMTSPNIKFMGQYFTVDDAEKWKGEASLLFIAGHNAETKRWLQIIQPFAWSVPFTTDCTPYLMGQLSFLPYAQSELRLNGYRSATLPGAKLMNYPVFKIQRMINYHNNVVRRNSKLFTNVEGECSEALDNGFDNSYILFIFNYYAQTPDAVARPRGAEKIQAFAKRVIASMIW